MKTPLNRLLGTALAAAGLLLGCHAWAADVTVTFIDPEHYRDAAYREPFLSGALTPDVRRDLAGFLVELGGKRLPPTESLRIEVLDVDLAGRLRPTGSAAIDEIRVMRDFDWPRIKLRYTLSRGEQVLASGEDNVTDMDYLQTVNRYSPGDRLRYEKPMLERWFRRTLEPAQAAAR
ncbi:hypothetical protein BH09PSE6_BH09PSE6_24120 [soil metagenome]